MKPRLLVVELWGLGDLAIASPFLKAATAHFEVTLLAKGYAGDLRPLLWPEVKVIPFVAPWTAFTHKYRLWKWPWAEMRRLRSTLAREAFDWGLSARWDPRDHVLLQSLRVRKRLGFARLGSQIFLNRPMVKPPPEAHRYENWRALAAALGFRLPPREEVEVPPLRRQGCILVHSGAGQPVRVWPLPGYLKLVTHLRALGWRVQVACDPDQREWWLAAGETSVAAPRAVSELVGLLEQSGIFVGNDSGPGHLATFLGVPAFTLFGPQLPEWFGTLHPRSEWMEGKACPYKPCSDYCRFAAPLCLRQLKEEEVIPRVEAFARARLASPQPAAQESSRR